MNIGILGSRGYPSSYGGFETMVQKLAPYLRDQGHHVSVYCRSPGISFRWDTQQFEGIRQIHTPGWDHKSLSTLIFGATGSIDALARRFDVVLVLNVANGFFLPIIKLGGSKTLLNVDGVEWERGKWGWFAKRIFRLAARCTAKWADELVVDAKAMSQVWLDVFGRAGVFIPYGAELATKRGIDRLDRLRLSPGTFGLIVARLVPENNVDLLLDAIEKLPQDIPFVVVGSSNYQTSITARLRALEKQRSGFCWLGHVSDWDLLLDLWAHCGVYLHGHSVGGTNPALLQALGCGAPTLALNTPFNREVVVDDSMLFEPEASVLALKILDVISGRQALDSTSSIVAQRYRWDDCCAAYEDQMMRQLVTVSCKGENPAEETRQ